RSPFVPPPITVRSGWAKLIPDVSEFEGRLELLTRVIEHTASDHEAVHCGGISAKVQSAVKCRLGLFGVHPGLMQVFAVCGQSFIVGREERVIPETEHRWFTN